MKEIPFERGLFVVQTTVSRFFPLGRAKSFRELMKIDWKEQYRLKAKRPGKGKSNWPRASS